MAPKKPNKETKDDNSWKREIEDAVLAEETFSLKIVLFEAAGNDQDRIYLGKFETIALKEGRYVVRNICKTETIFMINQLGAEKKVKDENLRVFEEGHVYAKEKQDIPAEILALIIKHLLIKMKEDYFVVQRQRLEVKEGLRQESTTMFSNTEVRGTVRHNPQEPSAPSTAKSKGNKKGDSMSLPPVPAEGKKYNTVLRERGEEWRDKVYIDDFPTDGPHMYVAISGFLDPILPLALIQIGVPISAVVQIRIDPINVTVPSTLLRGTKRGQSQTEILADQSLRFWENLQELRIRHETADAFKSTAFVIFSPPYWSSEQLSGDPWKIYDDISYLMYDIQDLTRQHMHYLDNMEIMHVSEGVDDIHSMNNYHKLIDDLPLECVTIYSVLNALLETTCSIVNLDDGVSRSSLSTALTMNPPASHGHQASAAHGPKQEDKAGKAEKLIRDVFTHLCQTEDKLKSYRVTYGEEYEEHKDPVILKYGDFAKYNNFHFGNINLDKIVVSTLLGMPINQLWRYQKRPEAELEAKVNFHVNVLLSCFERDDVETAEFNRLMHILSCRKLYNNRSSLKKHHLGPTSLYELKKAFLKRSVLAEPLRRCPSFTLKGSPSFPSITRSENVSLGSAQDLDPDPDVNRIKFLFDCPDISELVSAAEISNNHPINHFIDDFEFFEDFTNGVSLQVMLDAFNKFNCVDYKYCEVTDCIVLMFFNSHDKDGIAREEWSNFLPTPLCLQDFFDFVLEENYEWLQNEERIYDENVVRKENSQLQDLIDPFAAKSCIGDTDVEMDLLMEGSIKHEALQAELDSPVTTETAVPDKTNRIPVVPVLPEVDTKSGKKPPPASGSGQKKLKQSLIVLPTDTSSVQLVTKPFFGFDLGDRRFQTIGKDSIFISHDGTKVSTAYTLTIPMNLEYIVLNVVPGNGGIDFWIHKALGDSCSSEAAEASESFRVTTKDQININIKKRTCELKIENPKPPTPDVSSKAKLHSKGNPKDSTASSPESEATIEKIPYHSLCVSWPNGQITESVHTEQSVQISHIKQFFTTSNPNENEEMRCISLNGEVIIFKTSGEIEVLRPGGIYILINKCKKIINYPEFVPTESDKKVKDKSNKTKDKLGKVKTPIPEEDPAKLYGYTLDVEEFEIIETNGLRQKWTKNTHVDIEKLLIRTATDFCLSEIFSRRMDGTHCLLNKDGVQIFSYPNKTRIITEFVFEEEEIYPEWTDLEKEYFEIISDTEISAKVSMSQKSNATCIGSAVSGMSSTSKKLEEEEIAKDRVRLDGYVSVHMIYTIENPYFATITVNKRDGTISVDSPNNARVTVDFNLHYDIVLDSATCAHFNGNNLHISYEACPKCKSFTQCDINMKNKGDAGTDSESLQNADVVNYWLKMRDSFCKKIAINDEGNINLLDEPCSQEMLHTKHEQESNVELEERSNKEDTEEPTTTFDEIGKSSVVGHGKCREVYDSKAIRFFVLRRDLSCSEIVHRIIVDQYKRVCRWQPWCSINQYDTFGDHRNLWSLLTPVHLNETEKWRMDSKLADKPKYLTFKDLKPDNGKGFYHWMRPYQRFEPKPMKPENVLPPRLPRAFILRTLELQWGDHEREQLKGAKELLTAILKYRQVIAQDSETLLNVPIIDPRTEDERLTDQLVQEIGHKVDSDTFTPESFMGTYGSFYTTSLTWPSSFGSFECSEVDMTGLRNWIYQDLKTRLDEDVQSRATADITTKPAPEVEGGYDEGEQESDEELEEEMQCTLERLEELEPISPNLQRYWRRRAEELKEEQFYQYLLRESGVPPYFVGSNIGATWWDLNKAAGDAVTSHERAKMKCGCPEEECSSNTNPDEPLLM